MAAALVLVVASAGLGAATHRTATPVKPEAPAALGQHPLLPPQVEAASLIPELGLIQKNPTMAPAGFESIYSDNDWETYRQTVGAEADAITSKKASVQLEFAKVLLDKAAQAPERRGLVRLATLRVVAIAYRNKEGAQTVAKAMELYQEAMDKDVPTHVAGLWQMADIVARYSVTPREMRPKYSLLAGKANVQLAMLLLDGGQVTAAQGMIRMLGRHEPSLKLDPPFKIQAANARAMVNQSVGLLEEVSKEVSALKAGDANAPMKLYLYGKFAAPKPYPAGSGFTPEEIVAKVLEHEPGSSAAALEAAIRKSQTDVMAAFDAAEMLKAVGSGLPEGILRHRVLHAAKDEYAAYLKSKDTEGERVKRNLAWIALQSVVSDGASGRPRIRPLEAPPATQPATRPLAR